jgi:aminoglycoside/choline kinase family phosphotransferase
MPNSVAWGTGADAENRLTASSLPVRAPRQQAMAQFIEASGWGGTPAMALAGDASFRRYFRLRRGRESAVVMDAPPPHEDVAAYTTVAGILRGLGLSAPAVMAQDTAQGFLLIEDFGDDTYTRLLRAGADETALYALAIDVLSTLQTRVDVVGHPDLPPYNEERLLDEAVLLTDWYMPAVLGKPASEALREEYLALWRALLPTALELMPATLVLRDFHIDNLMLLPGRRGVAACGLLDFQDAVLGPPVYDLVSLLEDARRDVPEGLRRAMTERYLRRFAEFDCADLQRAAVVLAVQRNCKILGIFTRLWKRDGKPAYLCHIPRLWRLLDRDLRHPALCDIAGWLAGYLPASRRRAPDPTEPA